MDWSRRQEEGKAENWYLFIWFSKLDSKVCINHVQECVLFKQHMGWLAVGLWAVFEWRWGKSLGVNLFVPYHVQRGLASPSRAAVISFCNKLWRLTVPFPYHTKEGITAIEFYLSLDDSVCWALFPATGRRKTPHLACFWSAQNKTCTFFKHLALFSPESSSMLRYTSRLLLPTYHMLLFSTRRWTSPVKECLFLCVSFTLSPALGPPMFGTW